MGMWTAHRPRGGAPPQQLEARWTTPSWVERLVTVCPVVMLALGVTTAIGLPDMWGAWWLGVLLQVLSVAAAGLGIAGGIRGLILTACAFAGAFASAFLHLAVDVVPQTRFSCAYVAGSRADCFACPMAGSADDWQPCSTAAVVARRSFGPGCHGVDEAARCRHAAQAQSDWGCRLEEAARAGKESFCSQAIWDSAQDDVCREVQHADSNDRVQVKAILSAVLCCILLGAAIGVGCLHPNLWRRNMLVGRRSSRYTAWPDRAPATRGLAEVQSPPPRPAAVQVVQGLVADGVQSHEALAGVVVEALANPLAAATGEPS